MNEILQKRIEEAKQKEYPLPPMVDGAICKAIAMAEQTAYKKGATFALQNQWISVEEALPEEHGIYFVLINSKAPHITTFTDKWNIGNNTYNITHWMKIPSLKGGEK